MENQKEMGLFLYLVKPPKLNQGAINNINRAITNEIEIVIKCLPDKTKSRTDGFTAEFYKMFKELSKSSTTIQKYLEQKEHLKPFCEYSITLIHKPEKDTKTITKKTRSISLMNVI